MKYYVIPLFACLFCNTATISQIVSRGPYLQMVNQSAATIRWRTDVPTNSRINFGITAGSLSSQINDATITLEHELRLTGLPADTKHFYNIGSSSTILDANPKNSFITAPPANTTRKIRIAAFGDCGIYSANQINVRDQYLNYIGNIPTDLWVLMGDNAYSYGWDNEYQTGFFDIYESNMLRNHPLFPSPGNHDYRNSQTYASDRITVDYYKNFTLPPNGECGGVPSGSEAYYSFDWGPIHFLSLDSYGTEDGNTTRLYDTLGSQVSWIKQDLAANTKKWTIVYFHHPPYTQGGHLSDAEQELVDIRQNFIRILERFGVDLVVCGHSHAYERSYLLKNHYGNNASFDKSIHTTDSSSAYYNGTTNSCPYHYDNGKYQHGTVYVVAGSSGQSNSFPYSSMNALPFVYGNGSNGGSFFFEIDNNRLDAKMIGYDGLIKDQFTIMKEVNKVTNVTMLLGNNTQLTASWPGNYNWSTGATSRSVVVNPITSTSYTVQDNLQCLKDSFHVLVTTILPLQLSYFNGKAIGNRSSLNWSTLQEQDVNYFEVQKMENGSFTNIGRVFSKGNSTVGFSYFYDDKLLTDGNYFYRLNMVDKSAISKYSEVVKVSIRNEERFLVFPASVNRGAKITIQDNRDNQSKAQLIDETGKVLWQSSFIKKVTMPTGSLSAGTYIILIESGESKETKKIVIN